MKTIGNAQRQNIVSIPSIVVTPLTVVIRMKGFDKYSQTQGQRTVHRGEFRLQHLIKFCNVTFLMRSFKDKIIWNKQVYSNSDLLSNVGWQVTIFLIHGLKTRVGMFKNIGGNIPGGSLMGGNFPGGSLMGENFPGGSFPGTVLNKHFIKFKSWEKNYRKPGKYKHFELFNYVWKCTGIFWWRH